MRSRVRVVGPVLALAVACFVPSDTAATNGGHFVTGTSHAALSLILNLPDHQMYFKTPEKPPTKCTVASHLGTTSAATSVQLDIVPSYQECYTDTGMPELPKFKATLNGCFYRFTVAPITTSETEQTVDFVCPQGFVAEFHDPNCLIKMRPQTSVSAATYKNILQEGKHRLTLSMHAKFETDFHGGVCIFFGTKQVTELNGAATLRATDTLGQLVDLTAT